VVVYWGGHQVADETFDGTTDISFSDDLAAEPGERVIDLRIETPDAWQPRALGISGDFRRFAFALESLVIRIDDAERKEQ
jgi:hypothetical protein